MNNLQPTIFFVCPSAYPLGGVAVWLGYLMPGLQSEGFNIVCGVLDGEFHDASNYLDGHQFDQVIKIANTTGTRYGRVQSLRKAIEAVKADMVVSVNVVDLYPACALVKKTSNPNLKVIMTLHALEPCYFSDVEQYQQHIDAVIVTNKLTLKLVKQQAPSFESERIFYAPYGVDVHEVPSQKFSPSKPLNILYAGRIENSQKRCADLIEIVKELEQQNINYNLSIAGDGVYRKELLHDLGKVSNHINYLGNVKHTEMLSDIYPEADLLIITSQWETGPIVAWEAMSHNVIVWSSRYVGIKEEAVLIDGDNCLLFDIADASGAVEKLHSLDVGLYNSLISAGRKLIKQHYTKAKSVKHFHNAIDLINALSAKAAGNLNYKDDWPHKGRLEKWFGHKAAHYVRAALGRRCYINDAGAEWPHSYQSPVSLEDSEIKLS